MIESLTKEEFFNRCNKFDWYYEFSDDTYIYARGKREEDQLKDCVRQNSELHEIWIAFLRYREDTIHKQPAIRPRLQDFL